MLTEPKPDGTSNCGNAERKIEGLAYGLKTKKISEQDRLPKEEPAIRLVVKGTVVLEATVAVPHQVIKGHACRDVYLTSLFSPYQS